MVYLLNDVYVLLHYSVWKQAVSLRCFCLDKGSFKKCLKSILKSFALLGVKRIFAMEYWGKAQSLCKFSRYLVIIKIMKNMPYLLKQNADLESIFFFAKRITILLLYMPSFHFSAGSSSVLWDTFFYEWAYITWRCPKNCLLMTSVGSSVFAKESPPHITKQN